MRKLLIVALLLIAAPCIAAEVNLFWDASTTPTVTGYKIYYGKTSHAYGAPEITPNQTTWTVKNLGPGTWYFAATAFDAEGNESDFSNEVSMTIVSGVLPVTIQIAVVPTPGPQIVAVAVPSIAAKTATVIWNTSVDCDGTVFFGKDANSMIAYQANNILTSDHFLVLGGPLWTRATPPVLSQTPLATRTRYFFQVQSVCNGTIITSPVRSFTTQ